jgi:hypothetical protein
MRRSIGAAAMLSAAIIMIAGALPVARAADPPTMITFPSGDTDLGNLNEGPAGAVCPFPVDVVVHALSPGRLILFNGQGVGFAGFTTGAITADVTNLDTDETVTVNLSGPGRVNGDGFPVLGFGPWVIFEPIAEGGIRLLHGVTRFEPAPYGVHAVLIAGQEEDLCDRVA